MESLDGFWLAYFVICLVGSPIALIVLIRHQQYQQLPEYRAGLLLIPLILLLISRIHDPRLRFWLGSLLCHLVSHCYFKGTGQGRHFPRAHLGAITIPDAASSDRTQARADSIMNG